MLLPELQRLAGELGLAGTARMRKGDLVAAIQNAQGGGAAAAATPDAGRAPSADRGAPAADAADSAGPSPSSADASDASAASGASRSRRGRPQQDELPVGQPRQESRPRRRAGRAVGAPTEDVPGATEDRPATDRPAGDRPASPEPSDRATPNADQPAAEPASRGDDRSDARRRGQDERNGRVQADRERTSGERPDRTDRTDRQRGDRGQNDRGQNDRGQSDRGQSDRGQSDRNDRGQSDRNDRPAGERNDRSPSDRGAADRNDRERGQNDRNGGQADRDQGDDDGDGSGRRRRGRFRERNRGRTGGRDRERFGGDSEPVVSEDDVLLPVAGIVDILDSYGFIRTTGYLTGPNDVYVSLAQVRRYGLRRGDAVTGAVRQPKDGERRDKYNALVRLDTVNGTEPDAARARPEFHKLTPLYPQERLRLESEPQILTTRVIDLVMPLGKGQRALIVSPPKAGKTMVLQAIANAITTNNPECHLMVVLVDERPEEVTDMQRSVKGEVIASTFDRPPADHTTVAELSIERAKRLVELGHDVVVLLDSITRLGRAYNLAAPASGRILSGGVDSTALYPPKRFLGAARNIENGGSLTILATALVETGSTMDTVIFEEFKGTGNAELKLDRKIADRRVFPAVDVIASGTRKEELLMGPEEMAIVHKLRRVLNALDSQQALDLLLDKLKNTRTNVEFLMQIQKTTVGPDDR